MARRKKHTSEQVVNLLRQIEVAVANGKTTVLACKEAEITEQSYYRWRKEYGGLQVDQARHLSSAREGRFEPGIRPLPCGTRACQLAAFPRAATTTFPISRLLSAQVTSF